MATESARKDPADAQAIRTAVHTSPLARRGNEPEALRSVSFWTCNFQATWPPWAVAGATFLGLNVALQTPALLLGTLPMDPSTYVWDPLRLYYLFSLDLLGLFCLLAIVPERWAGTWMRTAVVSSVLFLVVYQTYDAVVLAILHRSPIVYADIPHLVGAAYLLINGGVPWLHIFGLVAAAGVLGLLGWTLPSLIDHLHRALHEPRLRSTVLTASLGVGTLVAFGVLTDRGIDRRTYGSVCYSTTECVVRNVQASVELSRTLVGRRADRADSTYVRYQTLDWNRRPPLYLIVIESYGSVLTRAPQRADYAAFMEDVADRLAADGWHAATAHSEAPVFGGLSWLSVASLLAGTRVEHQPTFEVLKSNLPQYPHLVRTLERQGYTTAALQPPVRPRPGLPVGNPYGFDRTIYLQDLNYEGPKYGWGIVPDQYSLAAAHEQFVRSTNGPFFLFFETASSHAPWDRPPPPVVSDPSVFNERRDTSRIATPRPTETTERAPLEQLVEHIEYEWTILATYLRTRAPENSLVVVIGDHQPYLADGTSLATPLHVLSRVKPLVRHFEAYGLRSGLHPSTTEQTLHHSGVYSMLVRALTAHNRAARGPTSTPLPPYSPTGIERAALTPMQK